MNPTRTALLLGLLAAPAPPAAAGDEATTDLRSNVEADVAPTLEVYRRGCRALALGATTQLQAVPWIGEEALVDNGDAANEEGFRLRRLRIGLSGTVCRDVMLFVTLNPIGRGDALVHDVRLLWQLHSLATLALGSAKVPYARMNLESSSKLRFSDRPLGTGDVALSGRLGAALEGRTRGGGLGYVAGVYNATPRFSVGNESGGLLYALRLESAPLGPAADLVPGDLRVVLGGGVLVEDGPTVNTTAYSVDAHVELARLRVRGELLLDSREPDAVPELPPTLPGTVERLVIVGEATVFLAGDWLEAAVRHERYDDNRSYEDYGDQHLYVLGLNAYLLGHRLKAQVNYVHRGELEGREIDNDAVVLNVVGAL